MKYTRTYLKKLEELCNALSYKVRYEQGHFQSGYCILESKKVLIINKFFDLEGRIVSYEKVVSNDAIFGKEINVSYLANGMYFVRIQKGDKKIQKAFVKN